MAVKYDISCTSHCSAFVGFFFFTKHPFSFSDWALMLYSLSLTGLTEEQREWGKEGEWMNKGVWRWVWLSSSRLKVATVSTINNTHSLQRPANGLRDESGRWLLDEQMITLGLTQGHHPLSLLLSRPLYALFHYPFPFFSVLFVLILLTFFSLLSQEPSFFDLPYFLHYCTFLYSGLCSSTAFRWFFPPWFSFNLCVESPLANTTSAHS